MSDSQTRPSCEACYLRVDGALGYLSSEETVTEWVSELETWFDCKEDFSSTEACTDYIRYLELYQILNIPKMFLFNLSKDC